MGGFFFTWLASLIEFEVTSVCVEDAVQYVNTWSIHAVWMAMPRITKMDIHLYDKISQAHQLVH